MSKDDPTAGRTRREPAVCAPQDHRAGNVGQMKQLGGPRLRHRGRQGQYRVEDDGRRPQSAQMLAVSGLATRLTGLQSVAIPPANHLDSRPADSSSNPAAVTNADHGLATASAKCVKCVWNVG